MSHDANLRFQRRYTRRLSFLHFGETECVCVSDSPPDDLFDRPRLSHSPRRLSDRATIRKEILNDH